MNRSDPDKYLKCVITGTKRECKDTKTFNFRPEKAVRWRAEPGQFAMLFLPGVSANPFSFSDEWSFTVREVCEDDEPGKSFTNRFIRMQRDDYFLLRGPYGRGFPKNEYKNKDKKHVIVAGGCAAAPLRFLASEMDERGDGSPSRPYALIGASTKEELLFVDDIAIHCKGVQVFTDDGSLGNKGLVTDGIKDLRPDANTNFYVCGPEKMMAVAAEEAVKAGAEPKNIYLSLERYMDCGFGLCAKCCCGPYMVCKDGPVFSYYNLQGNPDFGIRRRKRSGAFEDI